MTTSISNHNKLAVYSSQLGQISKKNTEEAKASIVNSINNASNSPVEKPQVEAAKQGKAHYSDIKGLHQEINSLKVLVKSFENNLKSNKPSYTHEKTLPLAELRKKIDGIIESTGKLALQIAGNETKAQSSKSEKLRSEISNMKELDNSISNIENKDKLLQKTSDNTQKSQTMSYDSKRAQKQVGRYQD
ncbi:hypothetical protein [Providencia manganoxydans]|uniref:hypothetical protein n=1 Tax=Providencia manganoxydans TaxID=2923283 RepID=UPI00280E4D1A|nr:hypothetical protein [Providencia stuartii]ELR5081943.1 hypothetical protein [Providencia stuartii]